MKHKYLDDLNVTERPDLWNQNDKRQKDWKEEREKYGFDERETWDMRLTFYCWLYERLKRYKDIAPIDLNYHDFIYNNKEYTQLGLIDEMIKRLEFYFSDKYDEYDPLLKKEDVEYVHEVEKIWVDILPYMWW